MAAQIITQEELAVAVVRKAREQNCTLLSALSDVVDELGIDVEDVKSYISDALRSKLEAEAGQLHLLKQKSKTARLF